jgi:hypothetical protein
MDSDLDLRKDSDKERAEKMLEQDKEDSYLGGGADTVELSEEQRMRREINTYYAWLDEGTQAYRDTQADVQEGGNSGGSSTVSKSAASSAVGGDAAGAAAGAADGATAKGSKDKDPDIGEKRKRTNFTATQTVFLTQTLEKGDLDTPEKRQKVAELFSRERKVIDTWYQNHKGSNSKDGK